MMNAPRGALLGAASLALLPFGLNEGLAQSPPPVNLIIGSGLTLTPSGTAYHGGTGTLAVTSAGTGTVTEVDTTAPLAGGPITGKGTVNLNFSASFTTAAGSLALANLPASTLFGNNATIAGQPGFINVGAGLTLSPAGTLSATVTGVTISPATPHGVAIVESGTSIAAASAMSNGQLLIGVSGADPAPQTMSGDATINAGGTLNLGSIVAAGTVGSATQIPVIGFDAKGRIVSAGTTAVATGIGTIIAGGVTATASPVALPNLGTVDASAPAFTTWLNQGSSLILFDHTASGGPFGLRLAANAGANNVRARYKTLPAGDFTLTTQMGLLGGSGSNAPAFGFCVTDGTKVAVWDNAWNRTANFAGELSLWSNSSTFASTVIGSTAYAPLPNPVWERLQLAGTVWTQSVSLDGFEFTNFATTTTATLTMTPNGVGVCVEEFTSVTAAVPVVFEVYHWSGI